MSLDKLAEYLDGIAKKGKTVFYSELVKQFDLPPLDEAWTSHPLSAAFDRLDKEDAEAGRPFRTSVVIAKELNRPGDGFFKSLAELKGKRARSEKQKLELFINEFRDAVKFPWS